MRHLSRNYYKAGIYLLAWSGLLFSFPSLSFASEEINSTGPAVTDIVCTKEPPFLTVSFHLKNGYPGDAEKVVKSGTPVGIIYEMELLSDGIIWNSTVASVQVTRTVYFDVIKGYFQIGFGLSTPRIISVRSLSDTDQFIFYVKNQNVIKLNKLEAGQDYKIRVRASVTRKVDVILPFKPLVSMFSSWGYTTDWYETTFRN